jgi:hypothetical protein
MRRQSSPAMKPTMAPCEASSGESSKVLLEEVPTGGDDLAVEAVVAPERLVVEGVDLGHERPSACAGRAGPVGPGSGGE